MDRLRIYISSFKLFLNTKPNKVSLGRWCSTNIENRDNVSDVLLKLGNYDNCYINTFATKDMNTKDINNNKYICKKTKSNNVKTN